MIGLQIPAVQTYIAQKGGEWLSKKSGFEVTLSGASISWFDQVYIKDLIVLDKQNNKMIDIEEATVDLVFSQLLGKTGNNIDAVELENARIYLTYTKVNDSTLVMNISQFINNLNNNLKKKSAKAPLPFSIDEIELHNVVFSLSHPEKDSITNGFDFNHFKILELQSIVKDFSVLEDSVGMNVVHISGIDSASGFHLKSLRTKFHLTSNSMVFDQFHLITNKSEAKEYIGFTFNDWKDWSEFNEKIRVNARLTNSDIHTKDLAFFAPRLKKYNQNFVISGDFNGRTNSFTGQNFGLRFGGNNLTGNVSMFGLPNFEETFMDFKLNNSVVDFKQLKAILKPRTYEILKPLGETIFSGSFSGFVNDFVAFGDFDTRFGKIYSDINLKVSDNVAFTEYSGNLKMYDFDLGKYTGRDSLFQKVTMNGKVEGKGITLESAEFELEGEISTIGIKQYNYTNIVTDAQFSSEFFNGQVSINDPNLQFTGKGSIDLRNRLNQVKIEATLDTANLVALKLSKNIPFFSSTLAVDGYGIRLNEIRGKANLLNSVIQYDSNILFTDTLKIVSEIDSLHRQLDINSEFFDAKVNGDFKLTDVFRDFRVMVEEYRLNIKNDSKLLSAYYANKIKPNIAARPYYNVKYTIDIQEIDPLVKLLNKNIHIDPNSTIEGNFSGGKSTIFNLYSNIENFSIGEVNFKNTQIDLSASKLSDTTKVLATGVVISEAQEISENFKTKNLFAEVIWDNAHIDFSLEGEQTTKDHYARIKGTLDFQPDQTIVHLLPSEAQIIQTKWTFNKNNRLILRKNHIEADSIMLYSDNDQFIYLDGVVSDERKDVMNVLVRHLELANLSPLTKQSITGKLDTDLHIRNLFGIPEIESNLHVKDLILDGFLIGNIDGTSSWNKSRENFDLNLNVEKDNINNIAITGNYNPKNKVSPLDLDVTFDDANLKIIEPFFKFMFSNLQGNTDGYFTVNGTPLNPIINGRGNIVGGKAKINYLNTSYDMSGAYSFEKDKISFDNMKLTDVNRSTATINGFVEHTFFKDFKIDIKGEFENFLVLNTTLKENDLFYGSGLASGDVHFIGPADEMSINANGKTEKGTSIHIPIGGMSSVGQEDFISFISLKDTLSKTIEEELQRKKLSGLDINLNLEVNQNAYCEIIFDIQAGDIIRGTGDGQLNIKLSREGDFTMFGDYTIKQGGYNFTLYNIINKEFVIEPNSTIKWFGDPYGAELKINAAYKQLASLSPLVDTAFHKAPEIRRSYPTEVDLSLTGEMLSPDIEFDIKVLEYPKSAVNVDGNIIFFEEIVGQLYSNIHSDEQELNRQVFSLIILRKFSAPESFNTAGSIGSSVSEFVSNQLSYWASQVDENLEIDVDLGDLSQEAYNTFQLRLSYAFMEGRLRITREGGFDNENPGNVANIVGDWTVEYQLSPDGKLRAKMFSKNNYNSLNVNKQTTYTTGFSISHTQSFDEVKELFGKSRKKKRREKQESKNIKVNEEGIIRNEEVNQ